MGEFIAGAGGKRLRPILLLMAARLAGYRGPRAVRMGCVVELLHTATLIHDDVVDQAPLRRGRPSANARWGDDASILVGDHLYSKSFALMVGDGDPRVLETLARATVSMTEAEVFQLERKRSGTTTEADYLRIITQKTASFMSACCRIGGILGGAESRAGRGAHALRARHRDRVSDQRRFARLRRRPGALRQGRRSGPPRRQANAAPHRHPRSRRAGRARAHPGPAQDPRPRAGGDRGDPPPRGQARGHGIRAGARPRLRADGEGGLRALPRLRGQGDARAHRRLRRRPRSLSGGPHPRGLTGVAWPVRCSGATASGTCSQGRLRRGGDSGRAAVLLGPGGLRGRARLRRALPRFPRGARVPGGGRAGRGAPFARAGLRFGRR